VITCATLKYTAILIVYVGYDVEGEYDGTVEGVNDGS
jgi:hypothetical protein